MTDEKITYDDIKNYEKLFTLAPSFLLERWAKKNTNMVSKFESRVQDQLHKLNDGNKRKLDLILNSPVEDLQAIMADAYEKSNKKQYKILANPKYMEFIELNLDEIRKMV
ncbi:hypothetical protein [uncultured Methanobrevibacter sp.]|uniref:hypothetical protein n=1 Tax=uncultured Methanobrevibacter sp. TaxID=253161 RepID=UPI0025E67FFD|nr:hypothetical protein [uncultured Methanobrevibacter sp.]